MTEGKAEGPEGLIEEVPLKGMRGAIAQAMTFSLQTMAQLTLHREVHLPVGPDGQPDLDGLSPNSAIVLAVGRALAQHPEVNATLEADNVIRRWARVDVGVAVAVDGGLVVPVLRSVDQMSGAEVASEVKRLADKARSGQLSYADMEGATFSITNLGGYGIDSFTPIVNPPQAAILGVGRVRETSMTLSLTLDHRALDGAPGALFLATVERELAGIATPRELS